LGVLGYSENSIMNRIYKDAVFFSSNIPIPAYILLPCVYILSRLKRL